MYNNSFENSFCAANDLGKSKVCADPNMSFIPLHVPLDYKPFIPAGSITSGDAHASTAQDSSTGVASSAEEESIPEELDAAASSNNAQATSTQAETLWPSNFPSSQPSKTVSNVSKTTSDTSAQTSLVQFETSRPSNAPSSQPNKTADSIVEEGTHAATSHKNENSKGNNKNKTDKCNNQQRPCNDRRMLHH